MRVLYVVVPLVAIFVFDGSPLLWGLAGLVFFIEPLLFFDVVEFFTSSFRRRPPAEEGEATSRDSRSAWRFTVPAVAGLVAIAYLIAR